MLADIQNFDKATELAISHLDGDRREYAVKYISRYLSWDKNIERAIEVANLIVHEELKSDTFWRLESSVGLKLKWFFYSFMTGWRLKKK